MTSRREKQSYVARQGQTRDHTCHWPGCKRQVPPAMWGCSPHWFRLPKRLRDRVWDAFQPGQERGGRPGREYLAVARDIQTWIREEVRPADRTSTPA